MSRPRADVSTAAPDAAPCADTERQIAACIDKFTDANAALIRDVRAAMRRRFPTAHELVYDNYNFFVIGFGPSERPSDALFSIAAAANGVNLCFLYGKGLPDPTGLLRGNGNRVRTVRLTSAAQLSESAMSALLDVAVAQHGVKFPPSGGSTVMRSTSAKQRPRRRAGE